MTRTLTQLIFRINDYGCTVSRLRQRSRRTPKPSGAVTTIAFPVMPLDRLTLLNRP
jgi:hypothetical protein